MLMKLTPGVDFILCTREYYLGAQSLVRLTPWVKITFFSCTAFVPLYLPRHSALFVYGKDQIA